ncbi:MAG: hypothetical protein ACREQI_02995 [Candidatus Binataceae bacterium]
MGLTISFALGIVIETFMRILKSLSFAWRSLIIILGLWFGLVAIRQEPELAIGLGNASALFLIAVGLSGWNPFEFWFEMASTVKQDARLKGLVLMLEDSGTRLPPIRRFNLIKALRWFGMTWTWMILFVGFGYCIRACFVYSGIFTRFETIGLTALWMLFASGAQELPMGVAEVLTIRLRSEMGGTVPGGETDVAIARMLLGLAMLAVSSWWTWHVYGK